MQGAMLIMQFYADQLEIDISRPSEPREALSEILVAFYVPRARNRERREGRRRRVLRPFSGMQSPSFEMIHI